jgi:hypothetical protein
LLRWVRNRLGRRSRPVSREESRRIDKVARLIAGSIAYSIADERGEEDFKRLLGLYELRYAALEDPDRTEKAVTWAMSVVLALLWVAGIFIAPEALRHLLQANSPPLTLRDWELIPLAGSALAVGPVLVLGVTQRRVAVEKVKLIGLLWPTVVGLISAGTLVGLLVEALASKIEQNTFRVAVGFAVAAWMWVVFPSITYAGLIILTHLYNRRLQREPVALIAHGLNEALTWAPLALEAPRHLAATQQVLNALERAAQGFEEYIPQALPSGDFVTDQWTRQTGRRIAAAIRQKKRWILTPKADTLESFCASIFDTLAAVATGHWDYCEQAEPEEWSHPELWRFRIGSALKTAVVAACPVVVFWLISLTPIGPTGILKDYFTIAAAVWAVVVLVYALDSTIDSKVSILARITSILLPGTRGG